MDGNMLNDKVNQPDVKGPKKINSKLKYVSNQTKDEKVLQNQNLKSKSTKDKKIKNDRGLCTAQKLNQNKIKNNETI